MGGLQSMGPPLLHVDSSGPGVEPVYLAVAGGFCSTAPLRKSPNSCSLICLVVMRPTHQVSLVKTEFAHVDQSVHKLYEFGKSFKSDHVD